jgi:DNA primase
MRPGWHFPDGGWHLLRRQRRLIPDDFKQQLLSRVDIVDVIERHVPLRKAGQNYVARCPFHNEKTPSFSVSPSKQFYHCFGCGAHGNAIGFLMEHGGLGYIDAVKELAGMVGMVLPEARPNVPAPSQGAGEDPAKALLEAARFYKTCLKRSEAAIAYLKQRGVSGEVAARFGLGYAPAGWQSLAEVFPDYNASNVLKEAGLVVEAENGRRYDRFRDRIMFPITDQRGNVIGFGGRVFGDKAQDGPKYLNSPETALFQKGQELFGLFQARQGIRKHGRVVVVEGYMDVVSLHQHGIDYSVATLGTATTPIHIAKLLRLADEVYFCFDGDAAGRKAAWRALEHALDQLVDGKQLSFMFFPEGEDPDSFVRRCAAEDVWTALPLSEFMARELASQVDLETVEGRAKLLDLAGPLLRKVAAPAYQLQLRRRFAKLADVSVPEMEELFGLRRVTANPRRPPRTEAPRRPAELSLTRWILHAILNEPSLAQRVDAAHLDPSDRFHPALLSLLELLARQPELGPRDVCAAAIEAAADAKMAGLLRDVQAQVLASDMEVGVDEFMSALAALRDRAERWRITELIAKAGRSAEETAELARLQRLVSERARLPSEAAGTSV